jgi:hypothetical protein
MRFDESRGTAMKDPVAQLSTITAALVGYLTVAGAAFATDTTVAQTVTPSLALPHAMALGVEPQPPAAPAPGSAPWTADVRRWPATKTAGPDCTKPCAAQAGPFIADQLLMRLGSDPLLGTLMAPITRGVPISGSDGMPALELAVIPTQITRGSGVVAIGRF